MRDVRDRLGEWQHAVRTARGWRRHAIAFAAGALANLAMAPFLFAPILFLSIPVLVWLIDDAAARPGARGETARCAALSGWWFGFGYFLLGLFWIGEAFLVEADKFGWLLPFAVTLMPAGLALFWAAATALSVLLGRPGFQRLLVLALALSGFEWLRGHVLTGFPWNVLGYALTGPSVFLQSAGLLGIYGLTLITVPIFGAPLVMMADATSGVRRRRAAVRAFVLVASPLLLLAGYGVVRLQTAPAGHVDGVKIRIVQPSIPQREKWLPEKQGAIFQEHLDLSVRAPSGARDDLTGITHVVWPEAAMPFLPLEHPEALEAIGAMLPDGVLLLTGALRREPATAAPDGTLAPQPYRAFNSLMVFGDSGGLHSVYDKTHLVPFGEYLPWQAALEAIGLEQLTRMRGGFTEGVIPRPTLSIPKLPAVGGLICYEAIFPGVGAASKTRPGLLLNVTNDGWFGNTTGPRQHFHQARVRAVEEGLTLIRVANNGISAVVGPTGKVVVMLGINAKGSADSLLPLSHSPPVYAVYGDSIFLLAGVLFAAILLFVRRRNHSAHNA